MIWPKLFEHEASWRWYVLYVSSSSSMLLLTLKPPTLSPLLSLSTSAVHCCFRLLSVLWLLWGSNRHHSNRWIFWTTGKWKKGKKSLSFVLLWILLSVVHPFPLCVVCVVSVVCFHTLSVTQCHNLLFIKNVKLSKRQKFELHHPTDSSLSLLILVPWCSPDSMAQEAEIWVCMLTHTVCQLQLVSVRCVLW